MTEIYGHRWTSSFGDSIDQDHAWAAVLGGLTGNQIAQGLHASIKKHPSWPPTAAEFRELCEEVPDMPSMDAAYREACNNSHPSADRKWSHPAIMHAFKETTAFVLANEPESNSKPRFEYCYRVACRMFAEGKLEPIPLALPEKVVHPQINREAAMAALAALKRIAGR